MQSVPITTKVVSSNPVHGELYWIQHYVIKFVSDLRQVHGFLLVSLEEVYRYILCHLLFFGDYLDQRSIKDKENQD